MQKTLDTYISIRPVGGEWQGLHDTCFQVKDQEEKITELEVENKQHEAQLMSLQQNRPKTAMQRPKTPQVGHEWPQNTTSRSQMTPKHHK